MTRDVLKTPLGALSADHAAATPREQLQAVVQVLLGRPNALTELTLGVGWWHWGQNPADQAARMHLRALRLVLRWLALPSGDEVKEQVVDLLRREVAPLLQVLDEEAQQTRRPVGTDPLGSLPVGGLRLRAEGAVLGVERHEGVVDALTGVEAVTLVGLLAQDLFSVHGVAPVARSSGEREGSAGSVAEVLGIAPVSVAAPGASMSTDGGI